MRRFVPGDEVCVVRAEARQRDVLLVEQASWVQRMQKALVQMNIQLTEVLSDVMGATGQAIIRAIVAGERDPKTLARHRNVRVKASEQGIAKAFTGNWRYEHLFVLHQALAMYDDIARHMGECNAKLQGLLAELGSAKVDLGKAPRAGSKTRAQRATPSDLARMFERSARSARSELCAKALSVSTAGPSAQPTASAKRRGLPCGGFAATDLPRA